ncbi:MAG: hypothetical protein IJV40_03865 [Oscillospiraceae bacterium]|nr:hypothetical protein [Oscillospiraceae bacterium]
MNDDALEKIYQERLEEQLIACLAERESLSLEQAMDLYYCSKLSDKIHNGVEGVQYLDHKVLAQILKETEPELF